MQERVAAHEAISSSGCPPFVSWEVSPPFPHFKGNIWLTTSSPLLDTRFVSLTRAPHSTQHGQALQLQLPAILATKQTCRPASCASKNICHHAA